ncbi:hypothetical protein P775_03980 [Puniceibacterium antarcticum]|uniref:DnaA N-terminal domain-containing protein n=1 Tax=Puniceibacterium antarcticum TaxID=1206336 RepID=A0A2G8RJC1_9RHOB|nr:DnaA N-terminal domain-containing protein [Puniceibacterium antarcticum]PIL21501.1 hypothetical protein P775_03980 [Puniceibacterium antarcticum]
MIVTQPVGRYAASRKYDVLTALGAYALAQEKGMQRLVLRLLTLITARYNWKADELVVGRREMARLWCVDERTVKRETAKLRAMGWLEVKRPGVRGRITSYALRLDRVLEDTRMAWGNVGEDFEARMGMSTGEAPQQGSVVPFPGAAKPTPPDLTRGDVWSLALGLLYSEDAQSYGAWLRALSVHQTTGDRLLLMAPSRFHAHYVQTHLLDRVTRAVRSVEPELGRVALLYPGAEG